MPASANYFLGRREFLAGAAGLAATLALPVVGMAQSAGAAASSDPVQRLAALAARNAFARLTAPDGFWTSRVARFGLPSLFRKTAANAGGPLGQDAFRAQLQRRLNNLAESGARGAAPAVADAAQKMTVADPQALMRGRPSAVASELRLHMVSGLVNAMIPMIEQTLTEAQDPIVAQAVAALAGVSMRDVAHAVALAADNGIWYEIGRAEAEIRANPQISNDPVLVAALRPPVPGPAAAPASSPTP